VLRDKAIAILKDPESFGISLSLACDALTNGAHAAWEFDTLLTYLDEIGCLPDEEARDRLLAVTAIRLCPSHLWDYKVYNNLMESLNGRIALPESVNECSVGERVWGTTEARYVANHYDGRPGPEEYGDDTAMYVACVLAHNGLVMVPPELTFASKHLDMITSKTHDFTKLKEDLVKVLTSTKVDYYDEDDAASVQARILREAALYLKTRKDLLKSQLEGSNVSLNY